MLPPFEEALGKLLAQYAHIPIEEVLSALELHVMARREELGDGE